MFMLRNYIITKRNRKQEAIKLMKSIKQFLYTIILTIFLLISSLSLSSCGHKSIEKEVTEILQNDLNTSIEIIKLYYNEEEQGCFVEFQTSLYTDEAAIKLDTGEIEYESEYDYWVERAEILRKQTPINESELHKYNQKIINSFYVNWAFSVAVYEIDGKPEDSKWQRIK